MVYGHGVETADRVSARFAVRTGLPVANLGQQGTCLLQGWMVLCDKTASLRPRVV